MYRKYRDALPPGVAEVGISQPMKDYMAGKISVEDYIEATRIDAESLFERDDRGRRHHEYRRRADD